FQEAYERRYGYRDPSGAIEAVDWFLIANIPDCCAISTTSAWPRSTGSVGWAVTGVRRAYVPELGGFIDAQVVDRYRMTPETRIKGPALIEEPESTTIILPGDVATVTERGNLLITINGGK